MNVYSLFFNSLFDCPFPFLCLSSALVEPTVPPSGSTLESIPESGSLRPVAPGSPKRCLDYCYIVFGLSLLSLQLLATDPALNFVFFTFLWVDCDWLWTWPHTHCHPQQDGHLPGDCDQPWWLLLHTHQCESLIAQFFYWLILENVPAPIRFLIDNINLWCL